METRGLLWSVCGGKRRKPGKKKWGKNEEIEKKKGREMGKQFFWAEGAYY